MLRKSIAPALAALCFFAGLGVARGTERILLTNGFTVDCHHREAAGTLVRLYLDESSTNYMEVEPARIVSSESIAEVKTVAAVSRFGEPATTLHTLIRNAGAAHNINTALLESVIQAESGGHSNAVSRTGARGLMQLMPATARSLGVQDSFAPDQNLQGGTTYLDELLTRYHDNIAFALAAYNAGPGAVDRYHGVPPFRETEAYVARIIREFNRRTILAQKQAAPIQAVAIEATANVKKQAVQAQAVHTRSATQPAQAPAQQIASR